MMELYFDVMLCDVACNMKYILNLYHVEVLTYRTVVDIVSLTQDDPLSHVAFYMYLFQHC